MTPADVVDALREAVNGEWEVERSRHTMDYARGEAQLVVTLTQSAGGVQTAMPLDGAE